ncbi:DUF3667 domain-containing protein [Sphingobium sp. HWE2-09]|uniref:DUF3667 domain-containing protein n=1 Tax=Sphingobium sp. HWE2-09 TaxID=3108390 RepID=UPI002DCA2D26|nr:DUF3667 domain-containing protein [Sphingobium sp. HWE2-09]
MLTIRLRIADALGRNAGIATPIPDGPVTDDWFAQGLCRNCSAQMTTPYCGQCGQKAAQRFVWRDIRNESWDRLRLFEIQSVRTLRHLLLSPGKVAREYVMGRRAAHMHPLKLLVALVAILVLLLAANQYFGHYAYVGRDAVVDRMAQQVMAYANWSFSLGIFAIFAGAWIILRRRLGYNMVELAILAIYVQSIILTLIMINLLPTLIWRSPDFILWHKSASQYYIPVIKLMIVAVAYRQFFLLDLKSDWPKLLSACLIYAAINWALLRLYALMIFWLVSR